MQILMTIQTRYRQRFQNKIESVRLFLEWKIVIKVALLQPKQEKKYLKVKLVEGTYFMKLNTKGRKTNNKTKIQLI